MARLRLRDTETRRSRLPELCMACGEPAETHIKKNFSWYPPWAGLLILVALIPAVIVIAILTKRMTVEVPVCAQHRGYFGKRILWTVLALLGWLGLSAAAFALAIAVADKNNEGGAMGFACLAFVLSL